MSIASTCDRCTSSITREGEMRRGEALIALLGIVATASCVRYQPQPLDPGAHLAQYRARRLDDPPLRDWVSRWAGPILPSGWTDRRRSGSGAAARRRGGGYRFRGGSDGERG